MRNKFFALLCILFALALWKRGSGLLPSNSINADAQTITAASDIYFIVSLCKKGTAVADFFSEEGDVYAPRAFIFQVPKSVGF